MFTFGHVQANRSHVTAAFVSIVAALTLLLSACRSVDKSAPAATSLSESETGTKASGASAIGSGAKAGAGAPIDCAKSPDGLICCEAMTPQCNDCRAHAEQTLNAWRAACLKTAAVDPDCTVGAPVGDCCSGSDTACADCRAAALNRLLAWKEKCADLSAVPCTERPNLSVCCAALIPSCEACTARNNRIAADWEGRCGQAAGKAAIPATRENEAAPSGTDGSGESVPPGAKVEPGEQPASQSEPPVTTVPEP